MFGAAAAAAGGLDTDALVFHILLRWAARPVPPEGRRDREQYGTPRLPDQPTPHLPGTPEKLAVMKQRAQAREQLHHPQDARWSLA